MPKTTLSILALALAVAGLPSSIVQAQFPNWRAVPVRQNLDLIPPLGNHLPPSYAARYNRPSWLTGRIAYTIEPSSQEAMAWQRAQERGYYKTKAPRMETHYLYPKPWEVLAVGARPRTDAQTSGRGPGGYEMRPSASSIERIDLPAEKEAAEEASPLIEPRSGSPLPPPEPAPDQAVPSEATANELTPEISLDPAN